MKAGEERSKEAIRGGEQMDWRRQERREQRRLDESKEERRREENTRKKKRVGEENKIEEKR